MNSYPMQTINQTAPNTRCMTRTRPSAPSMPLAVGAVWRGHQRSGLQSYDVEVRIAGVDDSTGDVCGTLTIKNLLPSLPKVVTFFDGEIIGPHHHDFVTDKWGATEEDDHAHWDKFRRDIYIRGNPVSASAGCSAAPSAYASPIPTAPSSEYGSDDEDSDDEDDDRDEVSKQMRKKRLMEKKRKSFKVPPNVVFMRLKERCFVNTNEGQDLSEASFDGFYYIAVELNPAPDRPQLSISKTEPFACSLTNVRSQPSLLSATAPGVRRPFGPSLHRSDSYASVVRGRHDDNRSISSYTSFGKPEEIGQARAEQAPTSSDAVLDQAVYSPSLEEFPPPPPSPSSLPSALAFFPQSFEDTFRARFRSSSSSLHRSVARAGFAASASRSTTATNVLGSTRLSTNFYNAKTGYKGPWAHAVMRGFYFTPPSSCECSSTGDSDAMASGNVTANEDDDDRDSYQELELFYVGDGLGAMLEENEIAVQNDTDGLDQWEYPKILQESEIEKIKKDLKRRQMYARPKASASFTVM